MEGAIEAESRERAAELLLERGFFVTKIEEKKGVDPFLVFKRLLGRVSKKDLAIFLRQLSILISASVPLVQALKMISEQTANATLKEALVDVVNEVEGGQKLSVALSHFPHIFNHFFVNMIKSGETSGRLDDVLSYLADQQERDYELEGKIKGAMMYPAFVITVMIIAGIVMMVFVLPKMLSLFTELGDISNLPIATKILIAITNFSQNYWWVMLIVMLSAVGGARYAISQPTGRIFWDTVKLKLPIFGRLLRFIYVVRLTRSLSTTLAGGVTLSSSLVVIRDVMGNAVFEDIITKAMHDVDEGMQLSVSLAKAKEIPAMVSQMVSVGEQTGKLDDVLERLTVFYTREINAVVDNVLTLIEPIIMVLLGLAVGVIVAGVLLPMYNLANV